MDENAFDYATSDVDAGSARFPARPCRHRRGSARVDLRVLAGEHGASFTHHAWDESGHL